MKQKASPAAPYILHSLGAQNCVTGSCHLLQINGLKILVDCGIAQGRECSVPMSQWPVRPEQLDYVFLTHAHIDHIGQLPDLVLAGFRGEIIASHPTKMLLIPLLKDTMQLSSLNKETVEALERQIDDLSWGFEYSEQFELKKGVFFSLGRSGHILGSCFIRFFTKSPQFSIVFSGDLGLKNTPIVPDPDIPESCDILVLESTYGDRFHEGREDRTNRLGKLLEKALSDGGKVFIPAFALGRTQELIYEMDRTQSKIPIFVDSPLGLEITKIYSGLSQYWNKDARDLLRNGDHPINFDSLYGVTRHADHLKLLDMDGPAIIIAGSGMCSGGRIVNHLRKGLSDPKNDVLFVGYQAEGTPGREIIKYAEKQDGYVTLDGERIPVKAKIHVMTGYSAHADQPSLVEWTESISTRPKEVRLVHGEPRSKAALAEILRTKGFNVSAD